MPQIKNSFIIDKETNLLDVKSKQRIIHNFEIPHEYIFLKTSQKKLSKDTECNKKENKIKIKKSTEKETFSDGDSSLILNKIKNFISQRWKSLKIMNNYERKIYKYLIKGVTFNSISSNKKILTNYEKLNANHKNFILNCCQIDKTITNDSITNHFSEGQNSANLIDKKELSESFQKTSFLKENAIIKSLAKNRNVQLKNHFCNTVKSVNH